MVVGGQSSICPGDSREIPVEVIPQVVSVQAHT